MSEDIREFLKDRRLFSVLDARALDNVIAGAMRMSLTTGQTLFSKGAKADCVYVIESGEIIIEVVAVDGRSARISQLGQGEVFGEFACLDNGRRTTDARALGDASLLRIEKATFLALAQTNAAFAHAITLDLVAKLRQTDSAIEDTAFLDLQSRCAKLLLNMSKSVANGHPATLKTTQAELAERLGASREKVNVRLQKLQENGAIKLTRGRISIIDEQLLQTIAAQ